MKITDGYDQANHKLHFSIIAAMAFASSLLLVAAFFMVVEPDESRSMLMKSTAFASLLTCIASYRSLRNVKRSFALVGLSGVVFSLAIWAFGISSGLAMLLGGASAIGAVLSLTLKEKFDRQVVSDDD